MTVWYCFKRKRQLVKGEVDCDLAAAHKKCGWFELHPAGSRVVSADSEHCDECGQTYDDVYALPDDLWALIHERAPAGLLCPTCALTRLADLIEGGTPIEEGSSIAMLVERGVLEQFDIGGYDSVTP